MNPFEIKNYQKQTKARTIFTLLFGFLFSLAFYSFTKLWDLLSDENKEKKSKLIGRKQNPRGDDLWPFWFWGLELESEILEGIRI